MTYNPMERDHVKRTLAGFIAESVGREGDGVSLDRAEALKRYHAMPYGDERPNRSGVLTTECRDTILWLLPSIIKTFLSTDKVVEFLPTSEGKEAEAEQQTDFINYVIMQENDSFSIFYTWFMDALQLKNGYVKYGVEVEGKVRIEEFSGLDDMALVKLSEDPSYEILSVLIETEAPIPAYSVKARRVSREKRYYVENIPPERVWIDSRATRIDDARFVGISYYKTRSDLMKMGYDRTLVESLPLSSGGLFGTEETVRKNAGGKNGLPGALDLIELVECYVKIDEDGDGIDELRRIVVSGQNVSEILEDEIVPSVPVVSLSPFLKPHSFFGDSMVDYVKDIQRISTTLWRQILDYTYLANNPMWETNENGIINMNDVLKRTPGGYIRSKVMGSIRPISTSPLQPETFSLLDRLKDMKDKKTGVIEIGPGLNSNVVNKTATEVLEVMDAGRQIQDMIVRTFAETGIKNLFKGLYGLVIRHQDIPKTIKLRNKWVMIDPSKWDENVDVIVNVGLGTGSARSKLLNLESILEKQVQHMQIGLSTPEQIYNTISKMIQIAGYKDVGAFVQNPALLPPAMPIQPEPTAAEMTLAGMRTEIEKARISAESKKYAADLSAAVNLAKADADVKLKIALKEKEMEAEARKKDEQPKGSDHV